MDTTTYLYILLAAIVSLTIAVFQYMYKVKNHSKSNILLSFLRFLTLFGLLLLLINPKISSNILEVVKPKLMVAIDNSSSIKFLKEDKNVVNTIGAIGANKQLNEKFDISYFSFSENFKINDSLDFTSNKTDISRALIGLNTLDNEENSTIVLLSDGNHTLGTDYSFFKSKHKIHSLIVGDTIPHEDLRISKLNVNKYSFLNNTFPIEVFINYNGNANITSDLIIYKNDTPVYKKKIRLSADNNSEKLTINLKANTVGIQNFRAEISKIEREKNTINNQKNFSVNIINEQAKIAIVSAMSHPDIGMLKRSIETNKQRKVDVVKPSNTASLKDYQLIILYQPDTSFETVFKLLERTKDNYFIIAGIHTDWNFLNNVQTSFSKNTINQIEDYFPVKNTSYTTFLLNDLEFDDFPPLKSKFGNVLINTTSEPLLFQSINGIKTNNPLLLTFKLSENRRGALLDGEGIWKWRLYANLENKSFLDFDNFINKLIQYLSNKKLFERLNLNYEPFIYQNDDFIINATYFDNTYEVDTRAKLELTLMNLENNEVKKYPLRVTNENYEISIPELQRGNYSFSVSVDGQQIKKSGKFRVLDYNIEQQFTYANVEALKTLASNSNGNVYHNTEYTFLIDHLINDATIKPIQKSTSKQLALIDWKWILALIVLSLTLEWFIRKYLGKI